MSDSMVRSWLHVVKTMARPSYRAVIESIRWVRAWNWFWHDYVAYRQLAAGRVQPQLQYLYPQLYDKLVVMPVDATYFYQDAWAFEHIVNAKPAWHVDVGSHHKYVALLSKVVPVTMVDIRPLSTPLDSLDFKQGSILEMPYASDSVPSLSSLCVVEHIGLGRYGDPLDPDGTEKAIRELKRVVVPGGNLYLSIPLDDENRIYFNAHRAFTEDYLLSLFAPFEVVEKRYIYSDIFGRTFQSGFGTGCYYLRKPM